MEPNRPGDVVRPANSVDPPASKQVSQPVSGEPVAANPPLAPEEPAVTWQYNAPRVEAMPSPAPDAVTSNTQMYQGDDVVTWTAAEYAHHEKSVGWYTVLLLSGLVLITLIYFLTKDKITAAIIGLAVIALAVYAGRKPRTLDYELQEDRIRVGRQTYGFAAFKSFAVYDEGTASSVVLMPLKRFMPPLTIYLAPEVEAAVVGMLGNHLPLLQKPQDPLDGLLRRLRF